MAGRGLVLGCAAPRVRTSGIFKLFLYLMQKAMRSKTEGKVSSFTHLYGMGSLYLTFAADCQEFLIGISIQLLLRVSNCAKMLAFSRMFFYF